MHYRACSLAWFSSEYYDCNLHASGTSIPSALGSQNHRRVSLALCCHFPTINQLLPNSSGSGSLLECCRFGASFPSGRSCPIFLVGALVPWSRPLSPLQPCIPLRRGHLTDNSSIKLLYNHLVSPRYPGYSGTRSSLFPRIPIPTLDRTTG